jgi:protein O-mannosyl-transferase
MIEHRSISQSPVSQPRSGGLMLPPPALCAAGGALIAAAVFVAYFPCVNGEFVLDDNMFLTNNPVIRAADGLFRFWSTGEAPEYYPAAYATNWVEWRLWELNPAGYHFTNLFLHIAESLLVWVVLRRLSIPAAFWAALIFALHPVNVESVAWLAQRRNMVAMLFLLLSILWYLKFAQLPGQRFSAQLPPPAKPTAHRSSLISHPSSFYWLSLSAFVFAMLAKGSVAVMPAILLTIIWWLHPDGDCPESGAMRSMVAEKMGLSHYVRRHLLPLLPFFVAATAFTAVNVWFQTRGTEVVIRHAGFADRLVGAGAVVWFYLYKAILPLDLAFVYPRWAVDARNLLWWLPLVVALAATAILWMYRKTWARPLVFAWGYFCIALVPVMGFVDVGFMQYSLVADHYQHIAIIGLVALAAAGFGAWSKHDQGPLRHVVPIVAVASAGVLLLLTFLQSGIYRDNITLYESTLASNPRCWMAHNNLGVNLALAGDLDGAIEHYNQALSLKSDYPEARNNLANALVRAGRPKEAIEQYNEALRLQDDYPEARDGLLIALALTGRPDEAIDYYTRAMRNDRNNAQLHFKLGNALVRADRQSEGIEQYQKAVELAPDYAEAHVNLGNALMRTGHTDEAIEHYRRALRLKPGDSAARFNLISAFARAGRSDEAVATAREALEIARRQGQTALARQIEDWLKAFLSSASNSDAVPPSAPPTPASP